MDLQFATYQERMILERVARQVCHRAPKGPLSATGGSARMRGFVTGVGSHTKERSAADPTVVYEGHDLVACIS